LIATKKKKLSLHLSKFIDENIKQLSHYSKLLNGEIELTWEDGTAVQRDIRINEIARIVKAIEEEYNRLEGEQEKFMQLYYFSPNTLTIDGASQQVHISGQTGRRWKKEFVHSIAVRLGWL